MENQVVTRRMKMIAAHFAPNDDISAAPTHIFPLNCSSSLNSVIPRCDNRMYFARRGSCSQSCFMRQVSTEQQGCSAPSGVPLKRGVSASDPSSYVFETPLFSRASRAKPKSASNEATRSVVKDCLEPAPEPPMFARPITRVMKEKHYCSQKKIQSVETDGSEWCPRMDVAESGSTYVVMLELPGVGVNDVRVEISDENLTVMGKRSTKWWKVETCSNDSISAYHRREISQGPYQIVWPLPPNANKDSISAEFLDGFLSITIPKL